VRLVATNRNLSDDDACICVTVIFEGDEFVRYAR